MTSKNGSRAASNGFISPESSSRSLMNVPVERWSLLARALRAAISFGEGGRSWKDIERGEGAVKVRRGVEGAGSGVMGGGGDVVKTGNRSYLHVSR